MVKLWRACGLPLLGPRLRPVPGIRRLGAWSLAPLISIRGPYLVHSLDIILSSVAMVASCCGDAWDTSILNSFIIFYGQTLHDTGCMLRTTNSLTPDLWRWSTVTQRAPIGPGISTGPMAIFQDRYRLYIQCVWVFYSVTHKRELGCDHVLYKIQNLKNYNCF